VGSMPSVSASPPTAWRTIATFSATAGSENSRPGFPGAVSVESDADKMLKVGSSSRDRPPRRPPRHYVEFAYPPAGAGNPPGHSFDRLPDRLPGLRGRTGPALAAQHQGGRIVLDRRREAVDRVPDPPHRLARFAGPAQQRGEPWAAEALAVPSRLDHAV